MGTLTVKQRGQALVEITLFLPIFIIIIVGLFEMGYLIIRYTQLIDATREAARYGADLDPRVYDPRYNHNSQDYDVSFVLDCNAVIDFYTTLGCFASELVPTLLNPDNGWDDVVVTAWTVDSRGRVVYNFPWDTERGWSMFGNQETRITRAFLLERMDIGKDDETFRQGAVIIEVFRTHRQYLCFPIYTVFIPCEMPVYDYAMFANVKAGSIP